eukprot:GHVO01059484.1.p3 GENE.GHVO01059484.1~~GHVO01059484.1.p3  ORF type:complete len:121 (-),score=11.26 GHVO01059484.1:794-1156(-)
MEQNTQQNIERNTVTSMAHTNEQGIREPNATTPNPANVSANPTNETSLVSDTNLTNLEREIEERNQVEAWKTTTMRNTRANATCDKSAEIFAGFDATDTRVQPAEFYRYHDPEIDTHGHF